MDDKNGGANSASIELHGFDGQREFATGSGTANDARDMYRMGKQQELKVRYTTLNSDR